MKREELKSMISKYSQPAKRPASRPRPAPKSKPAPISPARTDTKDMQWTTATLQFGDRGEAHEYTGLRIDGEPFIAIRADGPRGTSNRFYIHDIHSGREVSFARGNRADIYRALKRTLAESIARAEREQQDMVRQTKEKEKRERERQIDHAVNHGPGFYIAPFYSISEISGGAEPLDADNLYGEAEGDCLGPFPRDIETVARRSNAMDVYGIENLEDIENLYWEFFKKLPAQSPPFILIEAQSRKDALAGRGHIWIADGIEKGPAVDPRQTGFTWST